MPQPNYEATSTWVTVTTADSISINYPASVDAGDILIMQVATADATTFSSVGDGFSLVQETDQSTHTLFTLWKRADGTETGTVTFIKTGITSVMAGAIHQYSSCIASGTPYEDFTVNQGTSNSCTIPVVTPTNTDSFGVNLLSVYDDDEPSNAEYDDYSREDKHTTTTGSGLHLAVASYDGTTTITDFPADTIGKALSTAWVTHTFVLIPEGAFVPTIMIF